MTRIFASVSAEIEAEPEILWDIVANFENHPKLAGSGEVQRVRPVTSGPVRVGYRVQSGQRVYGVSYPTESVVIAAERGKVLHWHSGGLGVYPNNWRFDFQKLPAEDGKPTRTLVTHSYEFKPPLFGELTAPFAGFVLAPRVKDNARSMKRTLENLAATASDNHAEHIKVKITQ